ncbi:MAG: ABC transporter ATP-binding protein [Rhodospirillaceae bacterium]
MEVTEAPAPAPLEVQGVSTAYGKKRVLNDVSFSLRPAEVFGLVGMNGAGKTTLIRSMLNLRNCTGRISFFGEPHTDARARRHLIYLPERFSPSSQLRGFEHLAITLEYFKQALDRDLARRMARALDLDPRALDQTVRTYSKGMAQKLGLVGAFMVDARLMILDEPMSGLDPRARVCLKDQLLEARNMGRCIFFSSHILSDIEEICDRIAVLHESRIIFVGTPTDFVARFAAPTLERAFLKALDESEVAPVA